MGWLLTAEVVIAVLVAAVVLPLLWLFGRRRWLSAQGGVFDCALRRDGSRPGAWAMGMARYSGDELQWFRTFSVRLSPRMVLSRDDSDQLGTRTPTPTEAVMMFSGDRIIQLRVARDGGQTYELAMSREALTGLMSWLEAAPPGGDAYSGLEQRLG